MREPSARQVVRRLKELVSGKLTPQMWLSSFGRFQRGSVRINASESVRDLSRSYRVFNAAGQKVFDARISGLLGMKLKAVVFIPGEWCQELWEEHSMQKLDERSCGGNQDATTPVR